MSVAPQHSLSGAGPASLGNTPSPTTPLQWHQRSRSVPTMKQGVCSVWSCAFPYTCPEASLRQPTRSSDMSRTFFTARTARQQRGQGMTEYIIIVALIGVAAIAVYQFFGETIRAQTSGIANEVAGKYAEDAITAAGAAAAKADGERKTKGLDAYENK